MLCKFGLFVKGTAFHALVFPIFCILYMSVYVICLFDIVMVFDLLYIFVGPATNSLMDIY